MKITVKDQREKGGFLRGVSPRKNPFFDPR